MSTSLTEWEPEASDLDEMDEELFRTLLRELPDASEEEPGAPYPDADLDERDGLQDDLDELGGGDAPRDRHEAVELGRHWIAIALYLGVGYCLKTIRSLFGTMPLWPDAETAWEQAEYQHRVTNPAKIPWGVPIWWINGRYGHVALYIGRGLCITTDYKEPGRLCIARVDALASWCGGTFVGWTNDINGVVVWRPRRTKPKPKPWGSLDDRLNLIQGVIARERNKDQPNVRRLKGLRAWADRLRAKIEEQERKR